MLSEQRSLGRTSPMKRGKEEGYPRQKSMTSSLINIHEGATAYVEKGTASSRQNSLEMPQPTDKGGEAALSRQASMPLPSKIGASGVPRHTSSREASQKKGNEEGMMRQRSVGP